MLLVQVSLLKAVFILALASETCGLSVTNTKERTISKPYKMSENNDPNYWQERAEFLAAESNMEMGSDIQLSAREQLANKILLDLKIEELNQGASDPQRILPAQHFFDAKSRMEQSKVFQIIRKMPKGCSLHSHDSAMVSSEFVYNLTFMDDLYMCETSSGSLRFRFSDRPPKLFDSEWKLVKDYRKAAENLTEFNNKIKKHLTIIVDDPRTHYTDENAVWNKFRDVFSTVIPIITYRPALEKYWYRVLEELYEDNVMYLEFRGTLPPAYELDGTEYEEITVAKMYKAVIVEFQKTHPDFIGARLIYAPYRKVTKEIFEKYIVNVNNLLREVPDFFAGFDLVGQEDQGMPLKYYIEEIQKLPPSVNFFFHAGETNWYGSSTDLNLVDALLLNTTRIGHGFALQKHPLALKYVKERGIAIEVSPISNQVLMLVADLRNHPAAGWIAQNVPVVITNDDPGFWGASGLSYDFYEAFMGFTSRESDLKMLKQFALNSISYSAMPMDQKSVALQQFQKKWKKFIEIILTNYTLLNIR